MVASPFDAEFDQIEGWRKATEIEADASWTSVV